MENSGTDGFLSGPQTIWDGDKGLNTGGMGAYSPAPVYTAEIHEIVVPQVLEATVKAMEAEGRSFSGILYAGLC